MTNNLLQKIIDTSEKALAKKALQPINCKHQIIKQLDIPFIVRVVENLKRKQKQKKEPNFNPFLPYEKDLFVMDISSTHVAILNKFNVVNNHLLLITREFEPQENLLNYHDFFALATVFEQINGLGFYNSGQLSGASQPHKHLQFIPDSCSEEITNIPINNFILAHKQGEEIITIDKLPYLQKIKFFPDTFNDKNIEEKTQIITKTYNELLKSLQIKVKNNQPQQSYNLLVTQKWMMMIPRSQEKFKSISINSLGFAGALLVKDESQLEIINQYSPLEILGEVGVKLTFSHGNIN